MNIEILVFTFFSEASFMLKSWGVGWVGLGWWLADKFLRQTRVKIPFPFFDLSLWIWIWGLDFGQGLGLRLVNYRKDSVFVKLRVGPPPPPTMQLCFTRKQQVKVR